MITRKEWGAKRLTKYTKKIKPGLRTKIVIHHSVTGQGRTQAQVEAILRRIDDQHRANGWGGIGYNLAVDYAGRVYEARGIDIQGAHTKGHNTTGYGICFIGDGRKSITPQAVATIKRLVIELQAYSLKKLDVVGHNEVGSTACPGTHIIAEVKKKTFDSPYPLPKPVKPKPPKPTQKTVVVRPGDSYWRIAVRVLGVTNNPRHYPAIIKESRRIQKLNNNAPLVPGQKVKI